MFRFRVSGFRVRGFEVSLGENLGGERRTAGIGVLCGPVGVRIGTGSVRRAVQHCICSICCPVEAQRGTVHSKSILHMHVRVGTFFEFV